MHAMNVLHIFAVFCYKTIKMRKIKDTHNRHYSRCTADLHYSLKRIRIFIYRLMRQNEKRNIRIFFRWMKCISDQMKKNECYFTDLYCVCSFVSSDKQIHSLMRTIMY
jgi:hypothetical protein